MQHDRIARGFVRFRQRAGLAKAIGRAANVQGAKAFVKGDAFGAACRDEALARIGRRDRKRRRTIPSLLRTVGAKPRAGGPSPSPKVGREFPVGLIRRVVQLSDVELDRMLGDLQLAEFIYEHPYFPKPNTSSSTP